MGKKRRNNNNAFQNGGDDDDQFNLDKFDDRPTTTDGIKNNLTSSNNILDLATLLVANSLTNF